MSERREEGAQTMESKGEETESMVCECGDLAVRRTVLKSGPNNGRVFWTCPNRTPDGNQCKFWLWEDDKATCAKKRARDDSPTKKRARDNSPANSRKEREAVEAKNMALIPTMSAKLDVLSASVDSLSLIVGRLLGQLERPKDGKSLK